MRVRGSWKTLWIAMVVSVLASACSSEGTASSPSSNASQPSPTAAVSPSPTAQPDPLAGTWETGPLSQDDIVSAYVAAGGSEREGKAFFAQLGGGATASAVITIKLAAGSFAEFETGDAGVPVKGDEKTYEMLADGSIRLTEWDGSCVETWAYQAPGDRLTFRMLDRCAGDLKTPYGSTLYASFPFTRVS